MNGAFAAVMDGARGFLKMGPDACATRIAADAQIIPSTTLQPRCMS